jgi:hypothetical protein
MTCAADQRCLAAATEAFEALGLVEQAEDDVLRSAAVRARAALAVAIAAADPHFRTSGAQRSNPA